jgi:hypothetical protein
MGTGMMLYDTAEISKRLCKSLASFKENVQQKYFMGTAYIPATLYKYFKQKKSWGILNFIFGFISVIDIPETDFGDFRSDFLGEYEAICKTVLSR